MFKYERVSINYRNTSIYLSVSYMKEKKCQVSSVNVAHFVFIFL